MKRTKNSNDKNAGSQGPLPKSKSLLLKLDAEIAGLQEELLNPEFADDHVKLMELQKQIDELQMQHDSNQKNG